MGGAERQWSILIPAMRDRGFEVSVLTLVAEGPFFDELLSRGIRLTCARMRRRTDLAGLRRALRHSKLRPDMVVTQSINAHVVGHLIARRTRAAHVTTEHAGPGAPTQMHRTALTRLVGPRVDRAIAVSRAQIPRLIELGYRPERISLIPNGVPKPTVTEAASSVRSRLGVRASDFLAVLAATLRPEKSAEVFLRAVQEAHRRDPRVRGLIAGGGPELERLQKLAGGDGVIRVLGERSDIPDILNAADVACLSSSAEGVPMALLEAMALGKPCIATEVGGVPEAVEHEETGLLVPEGNDKAFTAALLRLASDQALSKQFGRAARERHRARFAVERMIEDYGATFAEVLQRTHASETKDPSRRSRKE